MHTFADLAKALNRSTVYLSGLQSRFELPTLDGAGYSEAYLNGVDLHHAKRFAASRSSSCSITSE